MGIVRINFLIHRMLEVNRLNRAALLALQDKRLRELLRVAVARSPFYREKYRGLDIARCPLHELPPVDKKEMMANFDDFVADRRLKKTALRAWVADKQNLGRMYLGKFIVFNTSGTTGENALVVYDRRGFDWVHAAFIARHTLPVEPSWWKRAMTFLQFLLVHRHRLAAVVMTGGPYPAYTASLFTPRFHDWFLKEQIFSLRDPVEKIVADLNAFQPDSLVSYPSLLGVLAREQLAGRLRVRFDGEYASVAGTSEPLSEKTKQLSKAAWGRDVQDTYGCAECFVLARSCSAFKRMHVMEDFCIVEVVDRHGKPVPDGRPGDKILVTNLFNHVQPFIRYEVGDVTGYSTEPCACGLPFRTLLPVEGRTDDVFYIDRPGGGYEAVHPYLFLGPIVELTEIREFQLAQTGRNEITFFYAPCEAGADVEGKVRAVLEEGMARASFRGRLDVRAQCVAGIDRDPRSGKFRQIISRVGPPADLDDGVRMEH
jgi:phenylacetate-coenzyme A ligase PaaK-like adenylate-forming protein